MNGGLYELDTYVEGQLSLSGNAYYGFDTLALGLEGSGMPTLEDQLIAGIADNNYWLGSLGISPYPHNFTNLNTSVQSMLSTLRDKNHILSTSWGYTAGASYLSPPVFGSLTLGGYDQAQRNSSATVQAIPFGADFSRDLVVDLQSITYDTLGSSPLLAQGISAYIDSMVTSMWLPEAVCKEFEDAFGLVWSSTSELYTLTTSQHNALVEQNPTFTFTFDSGSDSVDITFPYAAFDLEISPPLVDEKTHYFPLKRAQNESMYTLGRVFLQEAYVVADYDRQEFSIAQATHPGTDVSQNIRSLQPSGSNNAGSSNNGSSSDNEDSGIGTGTTAAIAVAAVAIAALVAIGIWFFIQRKKKRAGRSELPGTEVHEDRSDKEPSTHTPLFAEIGDEGAARHEVASESKVELAAPYTTFYEMPGRADVAEKDGSAVGRLQPVEMDAPYRFELDGGDGIWSKHKSNSGR